MKCKICSHASELIGTKYGRFADRNFVVRGCSSCGFCFVADPWTDFEAIYSAEYYAGKGVDPLVNYVQESREPESSVRRYEWRGIATVVGSLVKLSPDTRWLDYGAGTGGLVRYCRNELGVDAIGYEASQHARLISDPSVPFLDTLHDPAIQESFDVVTAIEVLEHVENPLEVLTQLRSLAKPGGVLFFTTGNVEPWRRSVLRWRYLVPEMHISLFTSTALDCALRSAGFEPRRMGYLPGYEDIIRFKILKSLGVSKVGRSEQILPWRVIAPLVNRFWGVSDHPVGFVPLAGESSCERVDLRSRA